MTTEEIQQRIAHIRDIAGDDESAHSAEDRLREDFIRYVSTLDLPLASKASLVLSTSKIDFERWCA